MFVLMKAWYFGSKQTGSPNSLWWGGLQNLCLVNEKRGWCNTSSLNKGKVLYQLTPVSKSPSSSLPEGTLGVKARNQQAFKKTQSKYFNSLVVRLQSQSTGRKTWRKKKLYVLFECKFCSHQQPGLRRKEYMRVDRVRINCEKRNENES